RSTCPCTTTCWHTTYLDVFSQAEDGIRDRNVTGVQTCALPIFINQLFKDGETNTGYKKVGTIRLHHNLEKLKELEKIALQRQQESPEMGEVKLLNPKETASIFPYVKGDFHSLSISGAARVDG